jgi:hypothetical protein
VHCAGNGKLKSKLVVLDSGNVWSAGSKDPYVDCALGVYRIMTRRQAVQVNRFMAVKKFYNGEGAVFACI